MPARAGATYVTDAMDTAAAALADPDAGLLPARRQNQPLRSTLRHSPSCNETSGGNATSAVAAGAARTLPPAASSIVPRASHTQ
ncbi:hypothetical protein D9O50_03360 [Oxalobacteraceae bacterium CAVE-383]|nr:hypothetical protein D9O50_03360 [Oxalobacteraceae bacterium CAVE-383]